jgi:ABC-2 type transport system ATP-binding protein
MAPLIAADGVRLRYGSGVQALDGVSLTVARGEVVGLLGPNGAGKSTLLRVLATLQRVDEGRVLIAGVDVTREPERARRHLGFLPQEFGFPGALTAWEVLSYIATLRGFSAPAARADAVGAMLHRVNLWADRGKPTRELSGGMTQRLGLAAALIGGPDVLIVDEPTTALDPTERHRMHDLLLELATERALLLSTHLVADVDALCERVLVLHCGRVVRTGAPAALTGALRGQVFRARLSRSERATLAAPLRVVREHLVRGAVLVTVLADEPPDSRFQAADPTLDDVFAVVTAE